MSEIFEFTLDNWIDWNCACLNFWMACPTTVFNKPTRTEINFLKNKHLIWSFSLKSIGGWISRCITTSISFKYFVIWIIRFPSNSFVTYCDRNKIFPYRFLPRRSRAQSWILNLYTFWDVANDSDRKGLAKLFASPNI